MRHITLLMRCHELLRKAETVTPDGRATPDADKLAKDINNYMNHISSHTHDCWAWGPEHYMCAYERVKELQEQLNAIRTNTAQHKG